MNYNTVGSADLYIPTPFRMTISGPSGCGKTRWIQRFLHHHEVIIGHKFETILFTYGEYQKLFDEIKEDNKNIIWCEGFSHEVILDTLKPDTRRKLIVVDDLLQEVLKDKFFDTFFIRRSHHWNVSIIFTTQYLHEKGLRLINLNTTHYVLFKSLRDQTPVRTLALQMFPDKWRLFMEVYTRATR